MKLEELMEVLGDGTACFSILPYCEEYGDGLESLKNEPWYEEVKNKIVTSVVTIGGGVYKVETCIELKGESHVSV